MTELIMTDRTIAGRIITDRIITDRIITDRSAPRRIALLHTASMNLPRNESLLASSSPGSGREQSG